MKTVVYELSKPLKYTGKEGEVSATFIQLLEPTGKVSHICMDIEALIQSAVVAKADGMSVEEIQQAKEQAPDLQELSGDAVLSMMTAAGVDMKRIVVHFRELFKQVALMGGEKAITTPRLDELAHNDFRGMIGVYVANFILS